VTQLLGHIVWISFHKEEKYGRLMGDVHLTRPPSKSFNTHIVENKFGKPYTGGHKEEFTEDELKWIIDHPNPTP
jgi:hypothetical protein